MATPVTPFMKSQPDVGKINTFEGVIVTVTKHPGPKNTVGTTVVPTSTMKKEDLLALPERLQREYGAGYYMFSATDAGGSGSDEWMTKLGPDFPEVQMAGSNGVTSGFSSQAPGAPQALGEGVIHLGHGFFYNEAMGTLTTPWRAIVSWKQGDPMPTAPASAQQPQQPNSTPWWQQQQNPMAMGWGGYPANDGESSKIKLLETQLAEERRRRELDDVKTEQRRQQDEINKRIDEQARQTREMFEKLAQALTAKPTGPDEAVLRMERQLEETKRENKEILARAEAREREDRLRAEIKASNDAMQAAIRDMNANKQDPMLPLLMNMMTSQQAQAAEAVKAIQQSTSTTSAANERSTQMMIEQLRGTIMSPVQLVQMMQQAASSGSDGQKMIVESLRDSMTMQREVFGQLLDVSNQGGQPAWVGLVQQTLDKVGSIGTALANRQTAAAQQQAQAEAQQRQQQINTQRQQQINATNAQQAQAQAAQQAQQAQQPSGPQPAAQVPNPGAPQARLVQTSAPSQAKAPTGKNKIKKGRRKKGTENEIIPGTQRKEGYTVEEMKEAKPSDVREVTQGIADEQFFGEIYPYINMLRDQVKTGMAPEGAAEMILRNRGEIQAAGIFPPAVQLLYSEQIEVLIERTLPPSVVNDEYRTAVVEIIEAQLVAEASGEDDDGDDDEGPTDE